MHAGLLLSLVMSSLVTSTVAKIRCNTQDRCIDTYVSRTNGCASNYISYLSGLFFSSLNQILNIILTPPIWEAKQSITLDTSCL